MPSTNFVDEEVLKQLSKSDLGDNEESLFPEHDFLLSCFRIFINILDLKMLTYIDVVKMFLPLYKKSNRIEERKATQNDINIYLKG